MVQLVANLPVGPVPTGKLAYKKTPVGTNPTGALCHSERSEESLTFEEGQHLLIMSNYHTSNLY